MVHWGWLILTFIAGIIGGVSACICVACCTVAKVADEEAEAMYDYYG